MARHFLWNTTGCLLFVLLPINSWAEPVEKSNWQKVAERADWAWSDDEATPFYGISQAGGKFDNIRIDYLVNGSRRFVYSIRRDGKTIHSWKGHPATVFQILGDRLYYADFDPHASGGKVVAVDLAAGKTLWQSKLKALGGVRHSAYSNRMNLHASEKSVTILGNESYGRYFEIKDVRTGETVGHKIFDKK